MNLANNIMSLITFGQLLFVQKHFSLVANLVQYVFVEKIFVQILLLYTICSHAVFVQMIFVQRFIVQILRSPI